MNKATDIAVVEGEGTEMVNIGRNRNGGKREGGKSLKTGLRFKSINRIIINEKKNTLRSYKKLWPDNKISYRRSFSRSNN